MIRAFDNFSMALLPRILHTDTTTARYYPLIRHRERLAEILPARGAPDKYACLALSEDALTAITGLQADAVLFRAFLHLHDFRERKLRETGAPPEFLCVLSDRGVRTSSAYLLRFAADPLSAQDWGLDPAEIRRTLCVCDLMRLPGVRTVRADLYYRSGYPTLTSFAGQDASDMRARIAETIERNGLPQSLPLDKELRTQIAVASILPHIL